MSEGKKILQHNVPEEWIDFNGHMNDAEYVRAFSWGTDALMEFIGMTADFRDQQQYTMYTLENHVVYLDEMKLNEAFEVHIHLLDYDAKRLHVFFELYGENNKRAATSEQMLMGIDQSTGRPAPFPESVYSKVQALAEQYTPAEKPKEAGRVIGIKRK
ncbi:thioesterase family protein [Aureibacillus halotolerans]|uniref:Acyl-CoA thioester hydrolase n=1 Tax=Aureibacillus halotolerans TaxID=1508390 RepID=A0A4R6U3A7_9BACI|nr:thioesterase family protein [Aureibacillus halotolerans]TDQ40870.1 acyl-CoA thioester hydrolase [Aureibacillus halotolerans]